MPTALNTKPRRNTARGMSPTAPPQNTLHKIAARKKTEPEPDPVFFTKDQVKVGSHLLCMGRLTPNTEWEVVQVFSDMRLVSTNQTRKPQRSVEHLRDAVLLRRLDGDREERETTFSNLSYSAIWRLLAL